MTLRAVPDPDEPGGGFGYLVLEGPDFSNNKVNVQVFDTYSDRWLGASAGDGPVTVGDGNWQSEPHVFGPYPARAKDAEYWVRIGPEIINKIAEYTPLRITVADHSTDIIWPDDVLPRIAPALVGEIRSSAVRQPRPERQRTEVIPDAEELSQLKEEAATESFEPEETPQTRWFIWIVLLGLVVTGAAYFFLLDKGETTITGIAYEPDTGNAPAPPCSFTALDQTAGGFDAVEAALRSCGNKVSATDTLRLLEKGVRGGSPEALLLFGKIYDVQQKDDLLETTVGLTFDDDPATAAEYYARAKDAGSPAAETLLIVTCQRLSKLTSTLARGAHDDHCPKP